jgi:type IV pilus assembly protein PilA
MPTKIKGMTSVEIAIIVAVVLAIAVAVGWYLYTTFSASVGSQPQIRVVSAVAFSNGTIKIEVENMGGARVIFMRAEVFDTFS